MEKLSGKFGHLFAVLVFSVFLVGYYFDDQNLTINRLSSDQWNIVPVMQKLQDTTLFKKDLYANNLAAVKQYIPAFVQSGLFFARFTQHNEIDGLRWFHLSTFLLFFVLWYVLFFTICKNVWFSILLTLVARGVLWPPGNEIWGMGDILFFLPRSVFGALVALPLLLFVKATQGGKKMLWLWGSLVLGLVSNYHPISGVGVMFAMLVSMFLFLVLADKSKLLPAFWLTVAAGLCFALGIGHFVWVFVQTSLHQQAVDPALFTSLVPERISGVFLNPFALYKGYFSAQWLILIFGPLIVSAWLYNRVPKPQQRILQLSGLFFIAMLVAPLFFYYAEVALRQLKIANLNVAFQLVRTSKYIVFGLYLMLAVAMAQLASKRWRAGIFPIGMLLCFGFIGSSFLGKSYPKKFPMFGFDFFRGQIPDALTKARYLPQTYQHLDSALAWISTNTPPDATFAGSSQIRGGAKRSVVFDYKGASMLIEENKSAFISWAKNNIVFEKLQKGQPRFDFYKRLGAEYVLTQEDSSNQEELVKTFYEWKLYKLKPLDN